MADVIIKKIHTQQKFYLSENEYQGFRTYRDALMRKFGPFVEQAVKLTNVPMLVFQSLLMVENATSEPQKISPANAIGLGQVTLDTAIDIIWRENKLKRLSQEEIAVLRKRMGGKIDLFTGDAAPSINGVQKMSAGGFFYNPKTGKSLQIPNLVYADDLKDPEFNLLLSAMMLSQLIDEEIEPVTNLLRLDRVIIRYNRSYQTKLPRLLTTDQLIAQSPDESKNYVRKMVGVNGMMSTLSA